MNKLETAIAKLPAELQDVARRYAKLLIGQTDQFIADLVTQMLNQNWQGAYERMNALMSNEDLNAEHSRVNLLIRGIVTTGGHAHTMQRVMVTEALSILLKLGRDALVG